MINKNIKLALLGVLLLGLSIFSLNLSETIITNENVHDDNITNHLTSAGFWNLTENPIYINDLATGVGAHNWTWAETQSWCSGSGSWADPYVIENVTINGNYSGSCIEISNSFAYFILKNCTFLHSSYYNYYAGIKLINVNNSKIIGNNCSFNDGNGISLEYCNNITILQNTMNNNLENGITIDNSYENVVKQNNLSFNLHSGLVLWRGSNNSIIENNLDFNGYSAMSLYEGMDNNISRNLMIGGGIKIYGDYSLYKIDSTNKLNVMLIYYFTDEVGLNSHNFTNAGQIILVNCMNSTISHLNVSNGSVGMSLYYCDNNTIEYNEFSNNNQFGLLLEECNNNTIINNIANNNDEDGILILYGNNNHILNNSAMWNNASGIYVFYNKYTVIENNTLNFNNRGLTIGQCEKCFVKNNTLDSNIYFGLYCYMGTNNNISNNYINGSQEYGIYFSSDKNYNVSSNTLIGCGFYLYGNMDVLTSHDIKSTNTVNGKPLYYYVNSEYLNPIDFFNAGQIILINCNNSLIANQTISNIANGISCHYCVNITILNNTLSYINKDGIYFNECKKISIRNNSVINNYNGISIINSNYVNISDNYLFLNEYNGILLSNCFENLIINNSVKNQKKGVGIQISGSVNSTVLDNRFDDNNWEAIMLSNDLNVTLKNNEMNNCGLDVSGSLENLITYDIDTSNRVNEKTLYYYTNKNYLGESDFVNAGQIFLINCNNSLISNVNLKNCTSGIGLYFSNNNTVFNTNSSYNWGAGIVLFFSNNNSILRNIASNCKTSGIFLLTSNNNNITENLVENNGEEGIYGSLALCYSSNNNQIRKNHINNNTIGLILYYMSSNNNISENFFFNNLEHGASIVDINSEQNMFYNNIFIGNLINAEDNGANNMWDNGIIGNYWDDYIGEDSNNNGIGDTPYQIQGEVGSVDNLPIWDDQAPIITILSPISDEVFGINAPDFVAEIVELYLDTMWYTLDGGITNITFTENGTISESAWDALAEGIAVVNFYANDTLGKIGSQEVTVKKDVTAPTITIQSPIGDEIFGINAPEFNVEIKDPYLDTVWYTIDGGMTNITFTENGTILQSAWDVLAEGNVVIKFYANDSIGNVNFQEVIVVKEITQPSPPGISGYDLLITVGTISVMVVIIIKKRINHLK